MSDDDRSAASGDLQRLRRRLYAPDVTAADRVRYADELSRAGRGLDDGEQPDSEPAPAEPPRSRAGLGAVAAASAVALVLGLALGAVGALQTTRSTPTRPAASPSRTEPVPTSVPRPVPAAALGSASEQRADREAFAAALRLPRSAARTRAVMTVGVRPDVAASDGWPQRVGCSMWIRSRDFSPMGLRSDLEADGGFSPPSGSRFRIRIFMARSADWSWVASGRRSGRDIGVFALGAGSRGDGSSQSVEFTAGAPLTISDLDIRTSPSTPFVWDVDSCTPD